MKFKEVVLTAFIGAAGLCSVGAQAALVLSPPEDFPGSGLGSVLTVLTLQAAPNEMGGVVASGSGFTTLNQNEKTGASQTLLRTLGEASITNIADLRVIFNAAEPGGAGNSISLNTLVLTFYDAAGTALTSQNLNMAYNFSNTESGTGNAGWVFSIQDASVATIESLLAASSTPYSAIRVGLIADIQNSAAGNETFFIARTIAPIPEPSTWAMLLAGLGMLGFMARRRAKQA